MTREGIQRMWKDVYKTERDRARAERDRLRKRLHRYLAREHAQRKHSNDPDCPACQKFRPDLGG